MSFGRLDVGGNLGFLTSAKLAAYFVEGENMATAKKTGAKKSAPKKGAPKRAMSDAHRDALSVGRQHGRIVRNYLEALEANKPRRGRKRTAESVGARLAAVKEELTGADPMTRLGLLQEQRDLMAELETMGEAVDLSGIEAEFIEVAAAYSDSKGISYGVWREMGVSAATLRAAGVSRS